MKDKFKGILLGLVVGVLISSTVVYAAAGTQIEVYFKNLKYTFDGVEKTPTKGKGFIYEGTTYVPIRFISEALGKTVHFNDQTETVVVGKGGYTKAPEMVIDTKKAYTATMETSKGSITIELFAKDAPITTNNFISLAKDGFYDDIAFHRIIKEFMIQTGDPVGDGSGGPGYAFKDELNNGHKYELGTVAMANSGPNTNGSQFFICTGADCDNLNKTPNYSIFGKVIDGMDVVSALAATEVEANPNDLFGEVSKPVEEVKITSITVQEKQ
ncbi:MAG: peptidyl-prolyl cis-trans isomerase [Bacilli bacterium]|nr:peptidyl-prolyl cis-trans isomerase [Bacilli bacterium]